MSEAVQHPAPAISSKHAPASKRRKTGDPEASAPPKKSKSCHACRRVKLRCVVEEGQEACKRCQSRGEECYTTTPLHDIVWQQRLTARVEHLTTTVDWLAGAVSTLANHLNINVGAPPAMPDDVAAALPYIPTPPNGISTALHPLPAEPSGSTSSRRKSLIKQQKQPEELHPVVEHAQPRPALPRTVECAEELLARAYADLSPAMANPLDGALGGPQYGDSSNTGQGMSLNLDATAPSVFGMLDFPLGSPELHVERPVEPLPGVGPAPRSMADRLLGSSNLEAVGSSDPRMDVVKSGLVSSADAEVLLNFFHGHLAPHLFGFPLQLGSWPYLPAGKSTITPLILGSICLIASERIPAYHSTVSRLVASDLGDSILGATSGLSWAPIKEGEERKEESRDGREAGGEEPDLDLELGIGPEEICALLVYASFSSSPRSDAIARCGFEWTRGYLKTFMLPSPPPVTYGEVFGLLPARRDLTFEQWLRLWLFAYCVSVNQCLHHETRAPMFDPAYFGDTLLSLNTPDPAAQHRDRELVAHARLCAILQRIQYARASAAWGQSNGQYLIQSYEAWTLELQHWWMQQNFHPVLPSSPASAPTPPLTPTIDPDISLTLFRLFAIVYVNLAAAREPRLADDPARWRFRARSVAAAYEMLGIAGDERVASTINLLFPFYMKMIFLSAMVLLDGFQDATFIGLPCTLEHGLEAVTRVADNLSNAPVPSSHVCIAASNNLRKVMEKVALKRSSEARGEV